MPWWGSKCTEMDIATQLLSLKNLLAGYLLHMVNLSGSLGWVIGTFNMMLSLPHTRRTASSRSWKEYPAARSVLVWTSGTGYYRSFAPWLLPYPVPGDPSAICKGPYATWTANGWR